MMKQIAIGIRPHSGWAVLVAVAGVVSHIELVDRRKIVITPDWIQGAKQPYHAAESMELAAAEELIAKCFAGSQTLAIEAIRASLNHLYKLGFVVAGCALVITSARPLPPLAKILSAHPLLHAAEGQFFPDVIRTGCNGLNLPVTTTCERDLNQLAKATFHDDATTLSAEIAAIGRFAGPPWTKDHKSAALAAMCLLHTPIATRSSHAGARG